MERKTNNNQEKYLKLLKVEALNNLKEVKKYKNAVSDMNIWQKTILTLIDSNHDTITENYISKAFLNTFRTTYSFNYENSTLFELKNSGELKNIRNDSLRKHIIALEPLVMKVKKQEQSVINKHTKINEYLMTQINWRKMIDDAGLNNMIDMPKSSKIKKSNLEILKQSEFENRTLSYYGSTRNLIDRQYPKLEEHLEKIFKAIEKELNKK